MGQEELVLKIPATEPVPGAPHQADEQQVDPARGSSALKQRTLTHSRESSGASVKFVNSSSSSSSNTGTGHRRTLSKSSGQSQESHVIILQSPSEDITLSDRLSTQDSDLDEEEELRTGCEDDFHERLSTSGEYVVDELRVMSRKNDSKSQNSDYGSFCNTPSDNFVHTLPGGVAEESQRTRMDEAAGGTNPTREEPDNANNTGDSTMPQESYQTEPLLDPNSNRYSCSSDEEMGANTSGYTRRKKRHTRNETRIDVDSVDAPNLTSSSNNQPYQLDIPAEPLKTLYAFLFLVLAWVATTTSLALTHERVPEVAPLPDVVLDNVNYQGWGLDASEIIIMVATMVAFIVSVFHWCRFVILRRIFFLTGIHYFYRAITMYITVLPKADPNYTCANKLENITFLTIANRVAKLLSGMGLSINGQHIYCGDYIYSGHTMTLLMTYLVIREYSPKRWFLLHWLSFCTTVTGILTLLFARGHYSIDVLIAYWITTRLWWIYHTLANNNTLTARENKHNYLNKFWWFVIFNYFEKNVGRPLPKGFNWPIPMFIIDRIPWLKARLGSERTSRTSRSEEEGEEE